MEAITNACVLAGGTGTRLRPLTNTIPKPAIEVGGKPVIRHILDWLEKVGFEQIYVKTYYLADKVRDAIGNDPNVVIIREMNIKPTAVFLRDNAKKLDEEFLVTNGDTLTNLNLKEFIDFHLSNKNIATIFTHHDGVHSGGTYVFDKVVLKYIKDGCDIPDLIQFLIEEQIPISLYQSDAYYFDTGDKEKLKRAKNFYEKK